jgi:hypothetical protein
VSESGIQVRPLRIRDFLRLTSLRTDAVMPAHERGLFARSVPDAVLSALPITRRERSTLVAFIDGKVAGAIDLVDDPVNHRWVLSRVRTSQHFPGPAGEEEFSRPRVWHELIAQAVRSAGAAGAKRIHAILDEDSPVIEQLEETGFSAYAQDHVLVLEKPRSMEPPGVTRRQEPSDVWAIHHLYHQVTPRPVQYAEALTSNYWGRIMPGQAWMSAYVIEDGLEVVAHCRVVRTRQGPALYPMVHTDSRELLRPLLADVVAHLEPPAHKPLYVVIPDYLQEYSAALEPIGVIEAGRHTRLVKYTTVARRMQLRSLAEISGEITEHVPAGSATLTYSERSHKQQRTPNT